MAPELLECFPSGQLPPQSSDPGDEAKRPAVQLLQSSNVRPPVSAKYLPEARASTATRDKGKPWRGALVVSNSEFCTCRTLCTLHGGRQAVAVAEPSARASFTLTSALATKTSCQS